MSQVGSIRRWSCGHLKLQILFPKEASLSLAYDRTRALSEPVNYLITTRTCKLVSESARRWKCHVLIHPIIFIYHLSIISHWIQ